MNVTQFVSGKGDLIKCICIIFVEEKIELKGTYKYVSIAYMNRLHTSLMK